MAKIVLNDVTNLSSLSTINDNFDKIEQELNDKILYRDSPVGENNSLQTDIDANGKRVYNLPKPVLPSEAARLQDIIDIASGGPVSVAENVLFTPFGTISSTNVQDAIEELQAEVSGSVSGVSSFNTRTGDVSLTSGDIAVALGYSPSPITSPNFAGNPTANTQATSDSSNRLATTQFVKNVVGSTVAGVSSFNTRTGAVSLNSGDVTAALGFTPVGQNSPSFTGVPTAPTPVSGTNTSQLATCAFVQQALGSSVAGVSSFNTRTGAVSLTPGDVVSALQTGANAATVSITTTSPTPTSNSFHLIRNANYSGGIVGWVNSALFIDTNVAASANSFEWGITSRINNSASSGENVGGYFQGNKLSIGPTWGAVAEVCDMTNANTTASSGGAVGLEVDVWCNGTDNFERRIGIDIVVSNAQQIRTGSPGIGKGIAYDGIRILAQGGDNSLGAFKYGINILSSDDAGIINQASGTRGIFHTGSYQVGIDLASSINADSAIRIRANEFISLDAGSAVKFKYNPSNGRIEFFNGVTRRGFIDVNNGADVDFAAGAVGAVDITNNQTISGIKTFTNYINASFGIVTSFVICNGDLTFDAGHTSSWASSGNVSSTAGSLAGYLRIKIDGTDYKIPFHTV